MALTREHRDAPSCIVAQCGVRTVRGVEWVQGCARASFAANPKVCLLVCHRLFTFIAPDGRWSARTMHGMKGVGGQVRGTHVTRGIMCDRAREWRQQRASASAHARGNVATHAAHDVVGSLSWSPRMLNTRGVSIFNDLKKYKQYTYFRT